MKRSPISLPVSISRLAIILSGPLIAAENKAPSLPTASPVAAVSPASQRDEAVRLLAKAKAAASELKEVGDRFDAFRRLAVAQAVAGEADAYRESIQKLQNAADEMNRQTRAESQKAEILGTVARTELEAGDLVSARKTADTIPDLFKRHAVLAEIGIRQARAGEDTAALATLDAMRNSETRKDDYTRASVPLAIAVRQSSTGDRAEAWKTLARIDDIEARLWAFGDLAATQAKAGDIEGALATADQIPPKLRRADTARDNAFKAVSATQARAGHFDEALAMAERVSDRREKEKALIEIGKARVAKGDLAGALATAERIGKGDERDTLLVEIIGAKARAGDVTGAIKDANEIGYDSTKKAAFMAIALAQAAGGDADGAIATVKSIVGSRTADFCNVAVVLYKKDKAAAMKAMDEARSSVGTGGFEKPSDDSDRYEMARAYTAMGEFESAENSISLIHNPGMIPDADEMIAVQMAATRGFTEAVAWAEKLKNPVSRCRAFTALAFECFRRPPAAKDQH